MLGFGEHYVVGYDISTKYSQISYAAVGDEATVNTLSMKEGTEEYNIPACLFKRKEVNQWFFGKEAINYSKVEDGQMVENLWEQALVGENITVVDEEFDPVALLSLYIKRSLSLLSRNVKLDKIAGIMFTVPELTKRAIEVLTEVQNRIGMNNFKVMFEGREESIYYYMIHQSAELWTNNVMVYDFNERKLKSYEFSVNRNAKPRVAFAERKDYSITCDDINKDGEFLDAIKLITDNRIITTAYLLGEGFEGDWCKDSLKELCRNRRVFRGNNLYSKGACYAALDKIVEADTNHSIVFLGRDKLKVNIGMKVISQNEERYFAILDGGDNWYDAKKEFDIIIDKANSFEIMLTPLDGRNAREIEIILDGLSAREAKTTRIHMQVYMESEESLRLCMTDLGFGDIYPATHQLFTRKITL